MNTAVETFQRLKCGFILQVLFVCECECERVCVSAVFAFMQNCLVCSSDLLLRPSWSAPSLGDEALMDSAVASRCPAVAKKHSAILPH